MEDRHDLRARSDDGVLGTAMRLHEVTGVADAHPAAAYGLQALHVHRDRRLDAGVHDGVAGVRVAPELLGHGVEVQAQVVGCGADDACVGGDSVQIQEVRVGQQAAVLVQRHGRPDEARMEATDPVDEHRVTACEGYAVT